MRGARDPVSMAETVHGDLSQVAGTLKLTRPVRV